MHLRGTTGTKRTFVRTNVAFAFGGNRLFAFLATTLHFKMGHDRVDSVFLATGIIAQSRLFLPLFDSSSFNASVYKKNTVSSPEMTAASISIYRESPY